ncbi:hypothetical protein ACFQ08_02240, partial [Streptosporangium algeriense]
MSNLRHAYLTWRPAGHLPGCRRPAWDVQTLTVERPGGMSELAMRAVCWGCGTVHDLTAHLAPNTNPDPGAGDPGIDTGAEEMRSEAHLRLTATWVTGYG